MGQLRRDSCGDITSGDRNCVYALVTVWDQFGKPSQIDDLQIIGGDFTEAGSSLDDVLSSVLSFILDPTDIQELNWRRSAMI